MDFANRRRYLTWENVDFAAGTLRVRSKPEFDFKIKDREERSPIPADLLNRLKSYRKLYPVGRLVTGTATDKPNQKLLRTLKRLVKSAGLNCGQCTVEHTKECERWWLRDFPRHLHHPPAPSRGMDLRTVMKFSGHSDLDSVMRYLSPAEDKVIKARVNAVTWM